MRYAKFSLRFCALIIVLTTLLWRTSVAHAARLPACQMRKVIPCSKPLVHSFSSSTGSALFGVATLASNNVWAVGERFDVSNNSAQTLVEHWDGTHWSTVNSPNPVGGSNSGNFLYWVTALAANNIWAVGSTFTSNHTTQTLIEHWNGSSWSVVASPNPGGLYNTLNWVIALSPNNIWAAGWFTVNANSGAQTLIEHWDGSSWGVIPTPNAGSGDGLFGVAAISSNDIWTVGEYYNGTTWQTLTEHWDGTLWSIVPSPNPGGSTNYNAVFTVATSATNDVWATGYYWNGSSYLTLIEHWNGVSWSIVASPNVAASGNVLFGVAVHASNDAWAVGFDWNGKNPNQTLTEHWNGSSWSVVASPNFGAIGSDLEGVAMLASNNAWAVGVNGNTGKAGAQALVEQWNGSHWIVVPPAPSSRSRHR